MFYKALPYCLKATRFCFLSEPIYYYNVILGREKLSSMPVGGAAGAGAAAAAPVSGAAAPVEEKKGKKNDALLSYRSVYNLFILY